MDCAGQSRNLGFDPTTLSLLVRPYNTNRVLTVVGTILDRARRTELSLRARLEEERVRAALVARDRRVATVRGDITGMCGCLLARQRVRALCV